MRSGTPTQARSARVPHLAASLLRAGTRLHAWALRVAATMYGAPPSRRETVAGVAPKRILVLRLDELGDVVLTTPLLRALRASCPDAHIEVVVRRGLASVLAASPFVDLVTEFDPSSRAIVRPIALPWRAFQWARSRRHLPVPDVAINARPGTDAVYAAAMALLSGATVRLGVTEVSNPRKSRLNAGFDRFYTETVGDAQLRHDADATLALLAPLGASTPADSASRAASVAVSESAGAAADRMLERADAESPVVALCTSGGHSELKRWPARRWGELAAQLHDELGVTVVVVGSADDAAALAAAGVAWPAGTIDLCGRTSLDELAAVLARADLYVGGDVGPTHVAAAVGTPTIALFGSSPPQLFAPRGADVSILWHELPCHPMVVGTTESRTAWRADYSGAERCTTCIFDAPRCMESIGVDEVARAVASKLEHVVTAGAR